MRLGAGPRLKRDISVMTAISAAYILIASLVSNSYYQLILTLVPIWAVFAVSWNILSGYGGQLSFGHASFFGIGAFTVTLALVYGGVSPWFGIPIAMVMGGVAAVVIGTPTFRLRGHYFALSMLAYPLAFLYFLQFLGLQEVALPMMRDNPAGFMQFKDPFWYTFFATILLLVGVAVSLVIENSRFGLALFAIRQNELAAEAAGLNARAWKMRSLIVSGMMAAAAGGLYAPVLLVVTPEFGVRPDRFGAARRDIAVRRRGLGLGPGYWRRHSGAAIGNVAGRAGIGAAGDPGGGVRDRDHRHHAVDARWAILVAARSGRPPQGARPGPRCAARDGARLCQDQGWRAAADGGRRQQVVRRAARCE